jgi:phytanoyl-CoA hydroxylase
MTSTTIAVTKEGLPVHIETEQLAGAPDWRDENAFRSHYLRWGYAVARGLVPVDLLEEVLFAFRAEVKPYRGPILRQLTTRMEAHKFSAEGFMTNTILSVQDLVAEQFRTFRQKSLEVLVHEQVRRVLEALCREPVKCVESMYFESSARGTITHADCHFMDSSAPGEMVAAWFAVEDIHPQAGRFYLLPESHMLGTSAPHLAHVEGFYREYEALSLKLMRAFRDNAMETNAASRVEHSRLLARGLAGMSFCAPLMRAGDVIFWGSRVLHGSLKPGELSCSRNSLTAHYLAQSHGYVQYGAPAELHLQDVRGMPVHHLRPVRH